MPDKEARLPNAEQQAVIDELDRNIILFASAGTGKTFTVAQRVKRIIEAGRARPAEILCLTFTIKAAGEMKEDILLYAGESGKEVNTRTIHSFAYQVLKEESVRDPEDVVLPGVCDEVEAAELLKQTLTECGLREDAAILGSSTALTNFSSVMKHERELQTLYSEDEAADFSAVYRQIRDQKPALFEKMHTFYDHAGGTERTDRAFMDFMDANAGTALHAYDQTLRQSNLLDFDDLICLTHKLFRNPEALARWQARYRYIIVDEMQDTSELEYDTLLQLFRTARVMMCGDFFQTIYQWRGSNPEKVLNGYIHEFDAVRFMFARNYRSTRSLTAAGFGYLRNTWPELMGVYCPPDVIPKSDLPGEPILNVRVKAPEDEALWIYDYLDRHRPEDVTKVCIMARSNPYIAKLYDALTRIGTARKDGNELRFFSVDKDAKFFRREVIRDILSFLRILVNPTDAVGFERVVSKYVSGVGKKRISTIREHGELGISLASFADDGLYRDDDPYAGLIRAFESGNVVVYDTETTGLDLSHDQMIQISAVRLNADGQVTETFDRRVIPTIPISKGAQATHRQTLEDVIRHGAIGAAEALEEFLAFCDGAVLVGHNSLCFDSPLVRRQLRENGLPAPNILAEYDTLPIARQFLPKSKDYKLDTLCGAFGIVNEAAHDALGDITATGRVLTCLLKRYIIPTGERRRRFLAEWRPRFEKIHAFLCELKSNYLAKNDVPGMAEHIIAKLSLRTRCPEAVHQRTLDDFLYMLKDAAPEDPVHFLRELLADAALSGSQMDMLIRKLKKIPIITVHQSKGCEFDTVIIAGADDDDFPTYQAKRRGDFEEEKRVFYVAISRARRTLIMTSASQKVNRGGTWPLPQSRWIGAIPQEYVRTIMI